MERVREIFKSRLGILLSSAVAFAIVFLLFPAWRSNSISYERSEEGVVDKIVPKVIEKILPKYSKLDKEAYDKKLELLANNPPPPSPTIKKVTDPKTGVVSEVSVPLLPVAHLWPVKTVYPKDGALLPFNRIIAYYGNLYSRQMGVLGQYPEEEMLAKLDREVKKWQLADPSTPVIPALHYIAVTAQASPGESGKYRLRMPGSEIEKVLAMAEKIDGIVFLDVQVGLSDVQSEIPLLEKFLKLPNVHLGIDPEFSMKTGKAPGKVIGTFDASDINFTIDYLSKIVKENDLPPKILVIHRFTQGMVTNYKNIKTPSEVQLVMHMDGWGGQAHKFATYRDYIYKEPVQFTGFKLFYKNDTLKEGSALLTPPELLQLRPIPSYIQFQ